eukprot:Gb_28528 [translate_table: standard]
MFIRSPEKPEKMPQDVIYCPNCDSTVRVPPGIRKFICAVCHVMVRVARRKLAAPDYRGLAYDPYSYGGPKPTPWLHAPPLIRINGNKRALLCGISYLNTPHQLKGCINDVRYMKHLLTSKFNFPEDSIVVLTEEERNPNAIPTRRNIERAMRWLVQGCQPGDSLVFHYSGHGFQQPNTNGEEVDGYDETLCPLDFERKGMIVDDYLNTTLVRPLPPGARLHAIIDSCHSGTMLDLPYVCWFNKNGKCVWEDHNPPNGAWKGTSGGEAISFSGCDDDQKSVDTKALAKVTSTGAMTFNFIKAIEKGEGNTYGSLLNAIRNGCHEARTKVGENPGSLTDMLLTGGSYKEGRIQEPQLSTSIPFNIDEKPFYL